MPIKFSSLPTMSINSVSKIIGLYNSTDGIKNCIADISDLTSSIMNKVLNSVFPIGSLYITKNNENPSVSLGIGTWKLVEKDRVLQTSGTNSAGSLIEPGLPSIEHTHEISNLSVSASGEHTHTRGTMNITGEIAGLSYDTTDSKNGMSGAFYWGSDNKSGGGTGEKDRYGYFDASRSWTGETSLNGSHTHTVSGTTIKNTNVNGLYGKSETVQPPALIVNVWERIS